MRLVGVASSRYASGAAFSNSRQVEATTRSRFS